VRGWLVPSAGQTIPVQPGWKLPWQKIRLAENKFLGAGKGAENANEKPGSALRVKTILFLSRVGKMNDQESPDPCDPIFEPPMNKDSHDKTNGWNRNYSKELSKTSIFISPELLDLGIVVQGGLFGL
jgi:hypothetical protein